MHDIVLRETGSKSSFLTEIRMEYARLNIDELSIELDDSIEDYHLSFQEFSTVSDDSIEDYRRF